MNDKHENYLKETTKFLELTMKVHNFRSKLEAMAFITDIFEKFLVKEMKDNPADFMSEYFNKWTWNKVNKMIFTKEDLKKYTNEFGDLNLEGTNITRLPDNLSVGGYLDIEGTNIMRLPENLNVGGGVYGLIKQ